MVTYSKYLGRVLIALYDDWPEVVLNLRKARSIWAQLSRILGWEGADPWTSGSFSKVIVKSTLFFNHIHEQ